MRRKTRMIFMHHKDRSFLDREKLLSFIDEVVAQGFFVDFGQGFPRLKMIPQNPVDDSLQPGSSDAMDACLEAFIARDLDSLTMIAYSTEREGPIGGFDFRFHFEPTSCHIVITLNHIAFMQREETCQLAFVRWLNLFLAVYEVWQPAYGYCYPVYIAWPEPTQQDIDLHRVPCLYEINFLGPAIVAQLGRERVFSTPAWKVQPLSDGGALIVPEFYFEQPDPSVWERVALHLDLPVLVPAGKDMD
jgi:hypothetical protein